MSRPKKPTSGLPVYETEKTILAQRLSDLIGKRGNELAAFLGLTPQSIAQMKSGKNRPALENLTKIADYYGVSVDFLLGRVDVATQAEDVQAACKTLGLSEQAATAIQASKADPEFMEGLEIALDSMTFRQLVRTIAEFQAAIKDFSRLAEEEFDVLISDPQDVAEVMDAEEIDNLHEKKESAQRRKDFLKKRINMLFAAFLQKQEATANEWEN